MNITGESALDSLAREAKQAAAANTVSEQERELAREAQLEYTRANYQACYSLLSKLEALRPQDLKVTHNKIVLDYCRSSEPSKHEVLRKSLNAICPLAAAAEPEDVDRSVLRYNQAVIFYHSRQYQAALEIVNNLFALIEPMGKNWRSPREKDGTFECGIDFFVHCYRGEFCAQGLSVADRTASDAGKARHCLDSGELYRESVHVYC